jgi:hypothetical protein
MATEQSTYRATNDAYTGMLAISLLALIAGSTLLFLDYSQYPDGNPKPIPKKALDMIAPQAPPAPPPQTPPPGEGEGNKGEDPAKTETKT